MKDETKVSVLFRCPFCEKDFHKVIPVWRRDNFEKLITLRPIPMACDTCFEK
jgi:hypothetical protein